MEILQGMTDMLHNQERKSKGENRNLSKETQTSGCRRSRTVENVEL